MYTEQQMNSSHVEDGVCECVRVYVVSKSRVNRGYRQKIKQQRLNYNFLLFLSTHSAAHPTTWVFLRGILIMFNDFFRRRRRRRCWLPLVAVRFRKIISVRKSFVVIFIY